LGGRRALRRALRDQPLADQLWAIAPFD